MKDQIQQALEALNSVDEQLRADAIELLGDSRHKPAVPQLVSILRDADPGTTFITAKALGKIADNMAVPALLDVMRGDDIWVRAAATGALINIGPASVSGLADALGDGDKAVRRAAAKALGKIGEVGEDNKALRRLSTALLDIDKSVRRFAAEALGRIEADTMVPELTEVLDDRDPKVRIAAFKALAKIDTPEAQQAVREWVRDQ